MNRVKKQISNTSGFSLPEVALFIAIAGVAFITILIIFNNISEQSMDSQIRSTMTSLASEKMELVRSKGFDNAFMFQNHYESAVPGYSGYSRITRVFYTDANFDSVGTAQSWVRVIVTVSHPEHDPISINSLITLY